MAASGISSIHQRVSSLAPIHSMCLDPPLLVVTAPACGTLQQWISSQGDSISVGDDFTSAWVSAMPWPVLLQLLGEVAAGLSLLHQQQPAVAHGSVHAAAVNLLQQLPDSEGGAKQQQQQQQQPQAEPGRVCQLSLVSLLTQLAPGSSCHPFLAAPEVVLAAGPATAASDVYGFGVLMFQLASGWLPQQYTPGTDEQICAVLWCRDMMAQAGSTSPLAAAQRLQAQQQQQQQSGCASLSSTGDWTPYGRHMLSAAALQQLPAGYVQLMEECLQRSPSARPDIYQVATCLREMFTEVTPVMPALPSHAPSFQATDLQDVDTPAAAAVEAQACREGPFASWSAAAGAQQHSALVAAVEAPVISRCSCEPDLQQSVTSTECILVQICSSCGQPALHRCCQFAVKQRATGAFLCVLQLGRQRSAVPTAAAFKCGACKPLEACQVEGMAADGCMSCSCRCWCASLSFRSGCCCIIK